MQRDNQNTANQF